MTAQSFVSKLVSKGAVPIYFITCNDANGKPAYAYIISTPEKMKLYEAARHAALDLTQYGNIIASGFGHTPASETLQMLKEKYGLEPAE